MMAGVKATYWAVIGADKRADNSLNWTFVLMLCGFIDWRGWSNCKPDFSGIAENCVCQASIF